MATLVFTAIGTAVGGPLGGAVGSLLGSQFDRAIVGSPKREGPRLKELGVSTSSYGTPIARHYGTVRAPGTIVWATDLVEHSETNGGGKGSPSATSFSYTVSIAVALSSRPILRLGRVWADGNLLRGAAGDLKTGGTLRIHTGHADQDPDPLIASAEPAAPAFRDTAYCVFEDLALGDFGNRIPALTFEIVADEEAVTLGALLEPLADELDVSRPLEGLLGYSNEGGALADTLAAVDQLYPIACDAGGLRLSLVAGDRLPDTAPALGAPAAATDDESFAGRTGELRRRQGDAAGLPDAVRYYDPARDYQPGLQRAEGRARPGRSRTIELPGVLAAADARALANGAATRAASSRDTLAWRLAELDPALAPGEVVRVPGRAGHWSIESWEWRDQGVELELRRLPRGPSRQPFTDAGQALPPGDEIVMPTVLSAFEAPLEDTGNPDARRVFAAPSSATSAWRGASLYVAESGGDLRPLGFSGRRRSVVGRTTSALLPSPALLLERCATLDVELASADFTLETVAPEALAAGTNRALVGEEIVQFVRAERLAPSTWQLRGLLRGRGGTELAALGQIPAGSGFVLLDDAPVPCEPAMFMLKTEATLAALGLGDSEPVLAPVANFGLSRRPLTPVHGRAARMADGSLDLSWVRRARGAWGWIDGIEVPLVEEAEAYTVGIGNPDAPALSWQLAESRLAIEAANWASVRADHSGLPLWVRQRGTHDLSPPLHLTTIA